MMLDITALTTDVAALRAGLLARGIIKEEADGTHVGALPGVEITLMNGVV